MTGLGPLAGMAAGLEVVECRICVAVACDLPLLGRPCFDGCWIWLAMPTRACRSGRMPMPTCAVYRQRVVPRGGARLLAGSSARRSLADAVHADMWVNPDDLRGVDPELLSF